MTAWVKSGDITQFVYFSAPPGSTGWTVFGSKGGAASAAFDTPTINETDATDMPGSFELLLDEQTTITAGKATEMLRLRLLASSAFGLDLDVVIFKDLPADITQFLGSDFQVSGVGGQGHGL